jgi:hypothetical protein
LSAAGVFSGVDGSVEAVVESAVAVVALLDVELGVELGPTVSFVYTRADELVMRLLLRAWRAASPRLCATHRLLNPANRTV